MPSPFNNNNNNKPGNGGRKKNFFNFSPLWMYAGLVMILGVLFYLNDASMSKDVSYSEFEKYIVEDHGINKIVVQTDKKIAEGFLTDSLAQKLFPGYVPGSGVETKVIADIPSADKLDDKIAVWKTTGAFPQNGEVKFERGGGFSSFLFSFGPFLLLIIFWIWMMRRMSGGGSGGGGVFSVGKSKAQIFDKDSANKVTFKDVAGLSEAKTEIEEIVQFLKKPGKYTELGGKIPKGALLVGPPGTGKTLLAKAVAGEANVPFFSMSGSDFVEMFVGVGASRVRDLFRQAKEKAPCIVFIDEIDAVGRARGKNPNMGANDERENTLNQLLIEMDGFGSNSGVIILAATNRADILDKALMRAGRFDRQIYVDLPDVNDRVAIFNVHLRNIKIDDSLDVEMLARQTAGFSGADIANVCNEAALIAARNDKKAVSIEDFNAAIDRIIGGLEKKNKLTTNEEKRSVAIHEAGHATVSWHLEYGDPLVKVTIVPRGKALGAAWYMPEERQRIPAQALLDQICSLMAGRAAEDLLIGSVATGALNDLERATKIAYSLVVYYGMSKRLPNISYYDSQNQGYGFSKPYSEERARIIDEEVSEILSQQYDRALDILRQHKEGLVKLAQELYDREVIFTADVEIIFGKRHWASRTDQILAQQSAGEENHEVIDVEVESLDSENTDNKIKETANPEKESEIKDTSLPEAKESKNPPPFIDK